MAILPFVTLDVFTTQPFAGNPLAVVRIPSDQKISTEQMQKIAREFNLSETVFIHDSNSDPSETPEWRIRIFMTNHEIPFAGHPTIGATCFALSTLAPDSTQGRLVCNAGPIEISLVQGLASAVIPHNVHIHTETPFDTEQLYQFQPRLREAEVVPKSLDTVSPVKGMTFACVELENIHALDQVSTFAEKFAPPLDIGWDESFSAFYFYVVLSQGSSGGGQGGENEDVVRVQTRMIEGLLEDPATGSAACALCSFLAIKYRRPKTRFALRQAVQMGRPSDIMVDVTLDESLSGIEKLVLGGSSVKVMEGTVQC